MHLTSETYRYITRVAGVRTGNPIVEGTRVAVHDVMACSRMVKQSIP